MDLRTDHQDAATIVPKARRTARPGVSPKLAALVRAYGRIDTRANAEDDQYGGPTPRTLAAAARARARIAGFASTGLPDVLEKARCLARAYPVDEAAQELRDKLATDHCYLNEIMESIAIDLMRAVAGSLE